MASSQTEGVPDCLEQTTALTGACGLHVADLRPWWLFGLCMHFWRLSLGQFFKTQRGYLIPLTKFSGKNGRNSPLNSFSVVSIGRFFLGGHVPTPCIFLWKIGMANCCCDGSAMKLKSNPFIGIHFRQHNVYKNFRLNEGRHLSDKKISHICRLIASQINASPSPHFHPQLQDAYNINDIIRGETGGKPCY